MGIRIWHQSFTVLEKLGPYHEAQKKHLERVKRPDTEIVMHGMHADTYRTNYPGEDIRFVAFQRLHGLQFIAAGLQAAEEGYDAYAIATLPDPWLRETRSLVDIPVVGYGESAMLAACSLGQRFGILVFIPEMAEQMAENVRLYGLTDRFVGAGDVGFRFNDVLAAYGGDTAPLIERFKASARAMIAQGADVIIPGEAPLCVILAANKCTEVDGVPVMDSLGAWVKQAEMLVDMRRAGVKASRRGYFQQLPTRERVKELQAFYGLDRFFK